MAVGADEMRVVGDGFEEDFDKRKRTGVGANSKGGEIAPETEGAFPKGVVLKGKKVAVRGKDA